ncbi:MAG TPA: ABC transporter ATP-binding protein [Candidatus Eisenbacteria bacterium]|nr:ABC transporter ATP-binding protein [Candidatus Eisenbacteria bacterium]
MIEVRDLRKSYGVLAAVDGVSFEVRRGETFGLLGPNGAGKTTTMHLLVGVLRPDGGTIQIAGEGDPTRPQTREKLGLAPQAMSLYPDLTGEENLAFFARLHGLGGSALHERVESMLALAGLTDRRKHRVRTYSGGMQRRLNLACALVHDPPVLLLDEPTVGVDPQSRNHLFENIESLRAQGRTILYTTHYMEEAQRLCDRVAIMDKGKILALDTVPALIERYGGASLIEAELEEPPVDGGHAGTWDGHMLRVPSERPLEEVARLAGSGVRFTSLHIKRPDLETVFLELTGRSLRD